MQSTKSYFKKAGLLNTHTAADSEQSTQEEKAMCF